MDGITELDKQQGTFQAWHGKTEVIEVIDLDSPNCFLRAWDVIARVLCVPIFGTGRKTKTRF